MPQGPGGDFRAVCLHTGLPAVDIRIEARYIQTQFPANSLLTQVSRVAEKSLYSNCIRPVLVTHTAS